MAFTSIVEMARMTRKSRHAVVDNHLAALGQIVDGYDRTAENKIDIAVVIATNTSHLNIVRIHAAKLLYSRNRIAVEYIYALLSAKPHTSKTVLIYRQYGQLRQSIRHRQMTETHGLDIESE